jgi:hypothetical protein
MHSQKSVFIHTTADHCKLSRHYLPVIQEEIYQQMPWLDGETGARARSAQHGYSLGFAVI